MPGFAAPDLLVWNQTAAAAALATLQQAAAGAAGPLFAGNKVDLWTANITPTPTNVLADLSVPVVGGWAGYVTKATTGWGAVRTDLSGKVSNDATPIMEWVGPSAGGGPLVQGYCVENAAGTSLLYSVKFGTPVPMTNATNVLNVIVTFSFPPTA